MLNARARARSRGSPCTPPQLAQSQGAEGQWPGEARISGRAIPAAPIEGPDGDRFRADIAEVVHTRLNEEATKLVVQWCTPGHGIAKDRPRLTVEAGPGPGHERDRAGESPRF